MNILIDILHPAHVHFFRYCIKKMEEDGHKILVTTRNKDITLNLLNEYNIPHTQISTARTGLYGMVRELGQRVRAMSKLVKTFKPDILMGEHGTTIAIVGKLHRIPSLVYWDTEAAKLVNSITYPLATVVYTPTSYTGKVHGHHQTYQCYQKLAYLHPNWFKPNKDILKKYNLPKKFILVRFVSWNYNHDKGCIGINNKIDFVNTLREYAPVFISSEGDLPPKLEQYKLKIEYKDIFDIMAFATMYIGESPTMATEAALLGVPSIYVSNSERGYINELQNKYKLVIWSTAENAALTAAKEIFNKKNAQKEWKQRQKEMLNDMIDVTQWMIDTVEKINGKINAQHKFINT